ncbi:hypothetical protein ACO22_01696 [Paracoccidioides brasiliensis]|uniref:Uncharacterized protein n=1 Tax=Paracoccidioides brasiliensis TaxID=121759 RepID=A0A1D2JL55_PARBR|nr:hypothetical protein ACO22_01696 [Paracoccidioides brasiliensis]
MDAHEVGMYSVNDSKKRILIKLKQYTSTPEIQTNMHWENSMGDRLGFYMFYCSLGSLGWNDDYVDGEEAPNDYRYSTSNPSRMECCVDVL